MEIHRTPDNRFDDLPDFPYEPNYAEVNGLRMHYLDEGAGSPIVCFHGEPSWSYLYRKMIPGLTGAGHRVICPDMAGFGRSDKPTDLGWYTYDRHCEQVTGVLDILDLSGATVVVQDWGGPVGLRWAVEHADRVERIVVMNTGLFTGRVSKGFTAWRDFVERVGLDLPVGKIIEGATVTTLSDAVQAAYDAPFDVRESKAGAATFPLLVPLDADSPGAAAMAAVSEALRSWPKPVLVAFSDSDPVFPFPKSGQVFVDAIPGAGEQVRIDGAAHFLQEDAGERIAEEIIAFLGR